MSLHVFVLDFLGKQISCRIMPTVIVIDVSLSMTRPVILPETGETYSRHQLGVCGINVLLDYLAVHSKLEFVSLVSNNSYIMSRN
jgi:hypothetical protein